MNDFKKIESEISDVADVVKKEAHNIDGKLDAAAGETKKEAPKLKAWLHKLGGKLSATANDVEDDATSLYARLNIKSYLKNWDDHWQSYVGLALALIFFAIAGFSSSGLDNLKKDESGLLATNVKYLANASTEAEQDLLKLAAIHGVLSVVESSQVGVDLIPEFSVTIGQAITQFSTVLDKAMLAVAASGVASQLLILLNKISAAVAIPLILLFLATLILFFASRIFMGHSAVVTMTLQNFTEFALIAAFFTAVAIPMSINVAAAISEKVSHELKQEHRKNLDNIYTTMAAKKAPTNLVDRAKNAVTDLEKGLTDIARKTEHMIQFFFTYLAATLIDALLLPLLILYGLYQGIKRITGPIFHSLKFELGIKQ